MLQNATILTFLLEIYYVENYGISRVELTYLTQNQTLIMLGLHYITPVWSSHDVITFLQHEINVVLICTI